MTVEGRITLDEIDYDEDLRAIHEGRRIHGEVIETDDEGRTVGVTTFTDGVKDGPMRQFYADGRLKAERLYRMGLPDGIARTWHPSGAIATELTYDRAKLLGQRAWSEDGTEVDPKTGQPVG